ncbi:MAG: PadR family transcriptional regulator [Pseudomonadota bacterium]
MNIKHLCLAVLHVGDASGYEIRKVLAEELANFQEVSFGALYPALRKLVDEGLATNRTVAQSGVPDKKVYAITDAGRAQFIDTLSEAPANHQIRSTFLMQLVFADVLAPERLRALMQERLDAFERDLAKIDEFVDCSDQFSRESRERVARFCSGALRTHCATLRDEIARLDSPENTPHNRPDGPVSCAG